ncbi:MAG TPA: UbiA-like polyprenyltransferase [bacterium]
MRTEPHVRAYARFIKLEHTLFSLPLIFAGAVLARRGWPLPALAALILAAAAGGRVLAMGLNRIIDADIDRRNPRTQSRELPQGRIRPVEAWGIVAAAGAVYALSAWAIAPVCLWLSPVPVVLFAVYPYLKRVTALAHLGLGLAWSMAPLGGWLAGAQSLAGIGEAAWLWAFSVCWLTGFDIIYATMDEAFDRAAGLHSLPARLGSRRALLAAAAVHAAAFGCLIMLRRTALAATPGTLACLALAGAVFLWQHAVAGRKPAFAFFELSAAQGLVILGLVASGV